MSQILRYETYSDGPNVLMTDIGFGGPSPSFRALLEYGFHIPTHEVAGGLGVAECLVV